MENDENIEEVDYLKLIEELNNNKKFEKSNVKPKLIGKDEKIEVENPKSEIPENSLKLDKIGKSMEVMTQLMNNFSESMNNLGNENALDELKNKIKQTYVKNNMNPEVINMFEQLASRMIGDFKDSDYDDYDNDDDIVDAVDAVVKNVMVDKNTPVVVNGKDEDIVDAVDAVNAVVVNSKDEEN
jgi:hypothetical protein